MKAVATELHYRDVNALYTAIGSGAVSAQHVAQRLLAIFGDEDAAAPRLSDLRLSPEEAQDAFEQSVKLLTSLLKLGKIHGDYSAYNLLWWQGKVIIIDLPQMVDIAENSHAGELLERDVRSLCTSFRRSVDVDPYEILREIKRQAGVNI